MLDLVAADPEVSEGVEALRPVLQEATAYFRRALEEMHRDFQAGAMSAAS